MKKLLAMVFLGIICLFVSSPSVSASVDELDAAIRDASDYLNKNVPKGSKIVFLNMQSSFPALSNYIIDELIANAVNDRQCAVTDTLAGILRRNEVMPPVTGTTFKAARVSGTIRANLKCKIMLK